MAAGCARCCVVASGLVRGIGEFLLVGRLRYAIVFAGPFAQINQLATLAAKRTKAVVDVPLMFFAAMWTHYDGRCFILHQGAVLQKVSSNGTS